MPVVVPFCKYHIISRKWENPMLKKKKTCWVSERTSSPQVYSHGAHLMARHRNAPLSCAWQIQLNQVKRSPEVLDELGTRAKSSSIHERNKLYIECMTVRNGSQAEQRPTRSPGVPVSRHRSWSGSRSFQQRCWCLYENMKHLGIHITTSLVIASCIAFILWKYMAIYRIM